MKPGDHPEFYRFPAPEGRSRESSIVLDAQGRFWHDGMPVEKHSMSQAFARWIKKHPDDDRFILENGYDWTYFRVEDVPFFVRSVTLTGEPFEASTQLQLGLSDGSVENLDPASLQEDARGALYCRVKQGKFEARFMPFAQTALGPLVLETSSGAAAVVLGGKEWSVARRA